jgi:hypothetical protein
LWFLIRKSPLTHKEFGPPRYLTSESKEDILTPTNAQINQQKNPFLLCLCAQANEEKDPALRYEKYTKIIATMGTSNVNVIKGNTKTSGSFGGKPKMMRSTQQRKHAPPAWLKGPNEEEKEK